MKEKLRQLLEKIRNPQRDENEKEFAQHMNFTRLLFFIPFLIAALIFFLLSLK
jgi:hypothetical protein